jgi:hypothetical protein
MLPFLIATLCVGDRIPIFGTNENGNRSDKEINNTILSQISEHMARFGVSEKAFIYIADSALVTPKNLMELSEGQPFVTRLPATYAECGRAISEAVRSKQWEEVGQLSQTKSTANRPSALYRVCEPTVTLSEYACESDAKAAAQAWASQPSRYHDISFKIEPHHTYARGRPKKDQRRQVTQVGYRVSCQLAQKASALEQMKMEAGCFVLLSNLATEGDGAADAWEILSL